jgi:putative transposase
VIETALGAELNEHLGYPPGQAPPGGSGNHRNGSTPKTVQTEAIDRTKPLATKPGRYQPPDTLLTFLEAL